MAFDHEYPYVDPSRLNLDWFANKVKELENRLDGIVEEAVKLANEYTDAQLANYQRQVDQLRIELTQMVNDVERQFVDLQTAVNFSLRQMDLKIEALENTLEADIRAVYERMDIAIEQNNEYILSELARYLANIEVLNALTGEYMTIQQMFNYLCELHATDAITYTELASRENTYTQLAGYYMTYTQLAMQGGSIIQ